MLVRAHGFVVNRGLAEHVDVELNVRPGLPSFSVIGLSSGAARDARERVQAAVLNSGFSFPRRRVTVNLAPGAAGVSGPAFDLALACCVLAAEDEIDARRMARIGLFAQLGLGGDLRGCDWVSAAAEVAEEVGLSGLIVARQDLREALGASAVPVAGLASLREVVSLLTRGCGAARPRRRTAGAAGRGSPPASKDPQRVGDQSGAPRDAPRDKSRAGSSGATVVLRSVSPRDADNGRAAGRPP